jgi:hypothetical protein
MVKGAIGIALAFVAALALAASPALASKRATTPASSKRPYTSGAYAGTVTQSIPQAYQGTIVFSIRPGVLSNLHFKVTMVCGTLLLAQVQSPPSPLQIKIAQDGGFAYAGTVAGTQVDLQGKLHGGHVTGTFFESFHTSPQNVCTMYAPAPFGAGL